MIIYNEQRTLDHLHKLKISKDFMSVDPNDKSVTVRSHKVIINGNNCDGFLDDKKHFELSFMSVADIIFEFNDMRGISSKLLQICAGLLIRSCNKLEEIDLSNAYMLKSNDAFVEIHSNQNLSSIYNIDGFDRLRCYMNSNPQLSSIGFKYPNTPVLTLNIHKSDSFTSLKNITNGIINSFQIKECVNLKTFDAHNASEIKNAYIACENITSYRNIDLFAVKNSILLHDMINCENVINILLSKVSILNVRTSENCEYNTIEHILDRYIHYGKKRCDYMMDCTLDLLNAGYDAAAEL